MNNAQIPGAIVAVSVFFQPSIARNSNLQPITSALKSANFGGNAMVSGLDLQALIYPALTGDIFVYECVDCLTLLVHSRYPRGSFTFPNCSQGVTWIVFSTTLTASYAQACRCCRSSIALRL